MTPCPVGFASEGNVHFTNVTNSVPQRVPCWESTPCRRAVSHCSALRCARLSCGADMLKGYVTFVVSIFGIGCVTAIIGDVASHFGCTLIIEDSVTAIIFVALGTSVPDTFASKVAAIQDKYADASVGNVTGSNAVNVFLGIGLAWSLAAIYHAIRGTTFRVKPGNMAFSVTIFCTEAFVAITVLVLRRSKIVGGELGGPRLIKYFTSLFFFCLWLTYVILSSLEVYHVIQGF